MQQMMNNQLFLKGKRFLQAKKRIKRLALKIKQPEIQ